MPYFHRLIRLFLVVNLSTAVASAAVPEKERSLPFSNVQYALLPVLLVGNVFLAYQAPSEKAGWSSPILFDQAARSALRAETSEGRAVAATVSNILLYSLVSYPYVVDVAADAGIAQGDGKTAGRLALINSQAFLATGAVVQMVKLLSARQRPFQGECATDSKYDPGCDSPDSRLSFFSGHTAFAFTAAGLICAHHKALDLAGGMAPCYVSLGLALATAMTRVMADRHYASDVLVGTVVGLLSGFVLTRATQSEGSYVVNRSAPLSMTFAFGL